MALAQTIEADGVVARKLGLGNLRIGPPPTECDSTVGTTEDVVVVDVDGVAEEADDGLNLTEVDADVADVVIGDVDVMAEPFDTRRKTSLAIANLVMLRMPDGHCIAEDVIEETTGDTRLAHIIHQRDGRGTTEVLETTACDLNATGILDIDATFGCVARVVFGGMPVAIGNVLVGKTEALNATEATRAFERHQVPGVIGKGHALDAEVLNLAGVRNAMQTQQAFAARCNDFGSGHIFATAEVEEGLCRTVEIELARFVEQFVGIAHIEKLVVVDLASPCHRVEDGAKRLLETYDDGVAPLVELAGTEYLFSPGLFLYDFHIFGIAEEMQFGIGYKLDAIHALPCTE